MKSAFANRGCRPNYDSPGPRLRPLATLLLVSLAFVLSMGPGTKGLCAEMRSAPNIVVILADDKY